MTDKKPRLCGDCAEIVRELIRNHERELSFYDKSGGGLIKIQAYAKVYAHFFKRIKQMVEP